MLDKFGVDSRWDAEVTNLLIEDGAVVGVRYESGSIVTDVRANNVIIATGGFIQNEDMLRDYYSGSVMYGTGNQYNDGAGIRLAQSAGAQMGKNFSTSINESGAWQHEVRRPLREPVGLQRHAGVQPAFVRRPHGE